jgi:hypothetical protein
MLMTVYFIDTSGQQGLTTQFLACALIAYLFLTFGGCDAARLRAPDQVFAQMRPDGAQLQALTIIDHCQKQIKCGLGFVPHPGLRLFYFRG